MPFAVWFEDNERALVVRDTATGARTEIRGAGDYPRAHNPNDPLHATLDTFDPATVSALFAAGTVVLNPKNARTRPSVEACARILKEA